MRLNTSSGVSTPYLDCPRWLPFGLLQHTGIDSLLLISLKTCLAFLQHYETPDPTHASLPTCVRLIELTTAASGTAARCNRLCGLSGGDIIGNIWIYASRNPDALRVSVDVIPNIAKVLGVGVSRYPKGLIPQLVSVFPLTPAPDNGASVGYKLSSPDALCVAVEDARWRSAI